MGPTLFILAHPDDDVFVRPLIGRARAAEGALVAYLTREPGGDRRRRAEATAALAKIGLRPEDMSFPGIDVAVDDGTALERLRDLHAALRRIVDARGPIGSVVTHAWEGGHPDHDAAHLLALRIARAAGVADRSRSVLFYRAADRGPLPIAVATPPPGAVGFTREPISLAEGFGMLAAIRHYPSQYRIFLGLGPLLAARLATVRGIVVQPLSASVAPARPHGGRLLGEERYGRPFETIARIASAFLADAS